MVMGMTSSLSSNNSSDGSDPNDGAACANGQRADGDWLCC